MVPAICVFDGKKKTSIKRLGELPQIEASFLVRNHPHLEGAMTHKARLKALRELRKHIADENDSVRLRELVVEINGILQAIEDEVAKLECRSPRTN